MDHDEEVENNINALNERIYDGAQTSSFGKETPRASNRLLKRQLPTVALRSDGPDVKRVKVERRKMNNNPNALNENHEGPVCTNSKQEPTSRAKTEKRPAHSSRYDGTGHKIKYHKDRQRCKKEGCNYKSHEMCVKCNVHLCTRTRQCFEEFHTL